MTLYLGVQSSQFVNIRVTFKNSPIHILEKFAFKDLFNAHQRLLRRTLSRSVILFTIRQKKKRLFILAVCNNP